MKKVIIAVQIYLHQMIFAHGRKGEMMTDTEMARRKAICSAAGVNDIGEVSDGFHTFNGLYEQRMILFASLVKAYKSKAWKSYRHEDGEYCFGGGWFVVGIDTPEGNYTYHYENKYWDMFDCIDLPRAPHWDGHTEADAETRLMSLEPERKTDGDTISRQAAISIVEFECGEWEGLAQTIVNGIKKLPSAQPKNNCSEIPNNSDLIDRQAAIDAINALHDKPNAWLDCAVDAVITLPSAQPEIENNLYLYKCYITDEDGLQHEVIHTGDIRRVTGWEI